MIDLSRRDWRERIRHGQSLLPDLDLDPDAVRRALGIFNRLRLPDVIGQPAMEEAAGDWFRAIVAAVFGTASRGHSAARGDPRVLRAGAEEDRARPPAARRSC